VVGEETIVGGCLRGKAASRSAAFGSADAVDAAATGRLAVPAAGIGTGKP
jgi:hypothetical protein